MPPEKIGCVIEPDWRIGWLPEGAGWVTVVLGADWATAALAWAGAGWVTTVLAAGWLAVGTACGWLAVGAGCVADGGIGVCWLTCPKGLANPNGPDAIAPAGTTADGFGMNTADGWITAEG
jgi:hypothetical protein